MQVRRLFVAELGLALVDAMGWFAGRGRAVAGLLLARLTLAVS
jgi:hypothetical protein